VRAPSLLPPILTAAIGREASAASLRAVCISYAELALAELSPASLNAELPLLETALRHTLQVRTRVSLTHTFLTLPPPLPPPPPPAPTPPPPSPQHP
jgi:hypothetical protein